MELHELEALLEAMTTAEKIGMIHGQGLFHTAGVERLGIPPLWMSDGPMGVRRELEDDNWNPKGLSDDFVSYLPSNTALACTWNRDLAKRAGKVLGAEARGRGKDVILAPGINLIRSPLCGRNFEYMSEDPCLIRELAVPLIEGIQEQDVAACVKHFAANNQETRRLDVDVQMPERALRELYLPGFEAAVKTGRAMSLMGAYNRFRGEHCCHSRYLLTDILRGEWQYDGAVISDWGGVHDTVEAAESGLDIEMSVTGNFDDYYMARPLQAEIEKGTVRMELLDEKVRNILRLMNRLHMLDGERKKGRYNTREHQEELLACAGEAVVLLKNEEQILPLKADRNKCLAVIGENAVKIHSGGGGSAAVKALYELSPLMGLKMETGGSVEIVYARGYSGEISQNGKTEAAESSDSWQADTLEARAYKPESRKDIGYERRQELIREAAALAGSSAEVLLFCGLDHEEDLEGRDRSEMKLPYGQVELIEAVLNVNPDTVIVVTAGTPVDMESFADRAKAIVYSSYNGMEGGRALARILLGKACPSGKLPFTVPKRLMDCPAHSIGDYPGDDTVHYREGIYVGYRHYMTRQIPVCWGFGHGLSYTEFSYNDLKAVKDKGGYRISVTVQNTGTCRGAEVVQLYVRAEGLTVERPVLELRDFDKIWLEPGEKRIVEFFLTRRAFSYYNAEYGQFCVPEDKYEVVLGSSVLDLRVRETVEVTAGPVAPEE